MINLVIGVIGRLIFKKFKVPRERLAYLANSTSATVCVMIPFNGWSAVSTVFLVAQQAEKRVQETCKLIRDGAQLRVSEEMLAMPAKQGIQPRPINMVFPLAAMVLTVPLGLLITGNGNITCGSGSTVVFWAVLMGIFVDAVLCKIQNILSLKETLELIMKGMGGLIPMGLLMLFAFTMGATCKMMGTGPYVSGLATAAIHPALIIPLVFLVVCFISFATGTSWGTFAIMIPIAVPLALNMGLNLPLMISAVMGGGVFGDHCSPVSDTTIIFSMATSCDHIDHVDTQLPYALTAVVFYLVLGLLMIS